MMGSRHASVPIFVGSYYALTDQMKADLDGTHLQMSYRSFIPFGPGGILYSDVVYGMGQFLPQGKNAYDIRNTPDTDEKAIPALVKHLDRTKPLEKITFLSIGTLTPFALMLSKKHIRNVKPLLRRVDGLYVMGGAVNVKGNIFTSTTNKKAEFNVFADPDGAELTFLDMSRYTDVTIVPLDAIKDVPLTKSLLLELFTKPKTPEAQLVGHLMKNLKDTWFKPNAFFQTAFLWDPSAAVTMLHSDVISSQKKQMIRVVVEEGVDGPDQGWTKPCTTGEILRGSCSEIMVIDGLDGKLLRHILVETLQQKENSAELPLVCLEK
ncbi:Inosine-uridine preferring nucleoside hydrolase [Gracilaria domingensis]|nr:Inosine-uridine preferring nucleoside hydrolase [Gracilaria domingensis]